MTISTLIVFFSWLAYGLFHSFLASSQFKNIAGQSWPKAFKNYRMYFVISAILTPFPILYYQSIHNSSAVWENLPFLRMSGGLMAGIGLVLLKKAFAHYDTRLFMGLIKEKETSEEFKSEGLLSIMRHPLYTSTLMIFWGWFLYSNSFHNLAFAVSNTLYILIGIQWEEKKLIRQYGEKYIEYKKRVPMLIPRKLAFHKSDK